MNDTTPEMRKKQIEFSLKMTPQERFKEGLKMIEFVRNTVINSIKSKNPDITPKQLRIEFFKRYYSKDFSEIEKERIIACFNSLDDSLPFN